MIEMKFQDWKTEYQPIIYEDTGAECFDHEGDCECEFLASWCLSEIQEDEELSPALDECRVWSWLSDGSIVSGVKDERADLVITQKPYSVKMEVR